MTAINGFERQLSDIQGRVFELSIAKGLDSADFIEKFMNSTTCEYLDMPYDRLQWAGEEYILESFLEDQSIKSAGQQFDKESLFWIGYVYRYWHLLTNESSKDIYRQADAKTMNESYPGFHSLEVSMAIENLKEIYRQKNAG